MLEGNVVTWQAITTVITVFVLVSGALWTIWWRIESKMKEAKESAYYKTDQANLKADTAAGLASTAREELAQYQRHVAENYVSKAGHRESTEQIMKAIGDIGHDMRSIRDRIDKFIDRPP